MTPEALTPAPSPEGGRGENEVPEYIKAHRLVGEWKSCDFCGARIQRGFTVRNNLAWFDEDGTNHFATCTHRDQAAALYGSAPDGTRQAADGRRVCPQCASGAIVNVRGGVTCSGCGWTTAPVAARTRPGGYGRRHPSSRSRMRRV